MVRLWFGVVAGFMVNVSVKVTIPKTLTINPYTSNHIVENRP